MRLPIVPITQIVRENAKKEGAVLSEKEISVIARSIQDVFESREFAVQLEAHIMDVIRAMGFRK